MELTKPQRRTCIFDYWNVSKKKKLMEETESLSRKSLTGVEDLSNELFYEIFNFLDVYDIYKAFYGLNIRLQSLLTNSTLPLKINISSMSKSTFQRYNRHIIMSNQHRITSLRITDPFVVDLIFSPVRIASNFLRLETLIFDNIKSKYLSNIISHLSNLTNLSSLVIIPIDRFRNPNDLYQHIFRLPVLKYCKVSVKDRYGYYPLTAAINITSPIEHLVIGNTFSLNNLNALSTYVPQLRRLTLHSVNGRLEKFPVVLNNLTHFSLNMKSINFDQFESMIRNVFHQLQVLHISVDNDQAYLNAKRWERFILSAIPQLRIFDFQYINFLQNINDDNQTIYNSILSHFDSPFWFERKWSFAYQFYSSDDRNQVIFYSTKPYRRKQYTLYRRSIKDRRPRHQKNMSVVNHLEIQGEEEITSCMNYFPNATKLTLSNSFVESRIWLSINLKRIISFNHLTTLVINCDHFCFEQLIKLLRFTPNIHILTFNCQSISETNPLSLQQSETFQLASNANSITNVTIKEKYSPENIKLFVALCPRMQQFTIDIPGHHTVSIVQFILLKIKTNLQHLCSLYIKSTTKSMPGVLKNLIESEELLDNYLLKVIDSDIYIWW